MRVCIPTMDDRGRDAVLSAHFGSAPYFTVVDSDTGHVEVVRNHQAHHAPGSCEAVKGLASLDVHAVVCLGLGRRAHTGLIRAGIDVFVADGGAVRNAVDGLLAGRLVPLRAEEACGGGRHEHCG
jgi:predicted Fe-Mo cluster-binding NifX family protein